jgi:hypothetical protein
LETSQEALVDLRLWWICWNIRLISGWFCHSEEADHELFCVVDSDRPTKNLSFPTACSVFFFCVKSKLIFPAVLNQRFFGRLGFRNISCKFYLFRGWFAASRSLRMTCHGLLPNHNAGIIKQPNFDVTWPFAGVTQAW